MLDTSFYGSPYDFKGSGYRQPEIRLRTTQPDEVIRQSQEIARCTIRRNTLIVAQGNVVSVRAAINVCQFCLVDEWLHARSCPVAAASR